MFILFLTLTDTTYARSIKCKSRFKIRFITIPKMHHNNMSTGSGLWHTVWYINLFHRWQLLSVNRNRKTCYYELHFRMENKISILHQLKQAF